MYDKVLIKLELVVHALDGYTDNRNGSHTLCLVCIIQVNNFKIVAATKTSQTKSPCMRYNYINQHIFNAIVNISIFSGTAVIDRCTLSI